MIAPKPLAGPNDLASFVIPNRGRVDFKRFFGFVW
jgi:hypothetical protein